MIQLAGVDQRILRKPAIPGLAVMIRIGAQIALVVGAFIAGSAAHARVDRDPFADRKTLHGIPHLDDRAAKFMAIDDAGFHVLAGRHRQAVQIAAADAGSIHAQKQLGIPLDLGNWNSFDG